MRTDRNLTRVVVIPARPALRRVAWPGPVQSAVAGCLLLSCAILLAGCGSSGKTAASTTTVAHHVPQLPANAVRIHWKAKALVPAPRAGHVCITTYKTGHFCASYRAGETPAVALRREARAMGWILVSSN